MKMKTRCHPLQPPELAEGSMDGPQPLGPLLVLLSLCITAGTPEVWVQVQREATKVASFTVRCGFLGSGSISLVTVSWGGPDGAGGVRLAVLHPEFGTQHWAPARQVHWETTTSLSLTLEGAEGRSPSPNTTFCCKFASFPEGSQEACGNLLSTDQGIPVPTSTPFLRADLAGILGVSGVLLFGCCFLLHLLLRQRLWTVPKLQPPLASSQTQVRAQAAGRASLALHIPYNTIHTSYLHPAALDVAHRHQRLSPRVPLPTSARGSFISVENGLYAQTGGEPRHTGPTLIPFPDPLEPRSVEGRLGGVR
ncbi:LOW QUALITY PROTEIN: transmembrane protein PVRIG [Tamandua tetradactyla]|uniref:LOW QUALITY PROTEIN: transmembrane protein PVRIG n=1 Tax=Tamandua tetradactyla TaxID=48850 RepID=UPI0040544944